jgi:hypothetical protein
MDLNKLVLMWFQWVFFNGYKTSIGIKSSLNIDFQFTGF